MSYRLKSVNITANFWHIAAVVLTAFGLFLAGLNRVPVPTVDGAVRASEARNMVKSGQLWPVQYQGQTITDHPPLFLWLTAASYKVFGISDFAANLVQRFSAFLVVLLVALIALEAGLGRGTALLSALILCTTRDFVLSSVRGYIEPLLEVFIYTGLWFALYQKRARVRWPAITAGACVWLAAFSKGPVALWPFVFFLVLMAWNGQTRRRRIQLIAMYLGSIALCSAGWAFWVHSSGQWDTWKHYLFGQVLSSALDGRGGAQQFEPLYFTHILFKFYWPWLPFLLWSYYLSVRWIMELDFSSKVSYSWTFSIFGFGFIAGFSVMRWKFWYYIAPAYPAFALFIGTMLNGYCAKWLDRQEFARGALYLAAAWVAAVSALPISLHHERVPEVMAFRETIVNSGIEGPVWFVRNPMDHNMVGTSGEWYFDRVVKKISPKDERSWSASLRAPSWIIVGADEWQTCNEEWCRHSEFIMSTGKSALVKYIR